jgi:hypothetical protein
LIIFRRANIGSKIPLVWDVFLAEAKKEHEAAQKKYEKDRAAWEEALRTSSRRRGADTRISTEPEAPSPRMRDHEEINFLRFATALKMMVGSSIRMDKVDRARSLLEEYLVGFSEVCRVSSSAIEQLTARL